MIIMALTISTNHLDALHPDWLLRYSMLLVLVVRSTPPNLYDVPLLSETRVPASEDSTWRFSNRQRFNLRAQSSSSLLN